jgi:UDP-N-acetylmuramoylalanine-D-glutamate ligase
MKSYKFYLHASNYFLDFAENNSLNQEEKEYYSLSSVLLSWIALETFVNTISETFSIGSRLEKHEKCFLNEKELRVNDDGNFEETTIRPPTTKKILFILNHFTKTSVKKIKQEKIWKELKSFEDLRNRIIHYKEKNNITIDIKKAKDCRDLINESIKLLTKKLR